VVNGEMSLRRLKLSIYEVATPREEEEAYNYMLSLCAACTYLATDSIVK
jgi:hypothetical protein